MSVIALDTLKYSKKLINAGVPQQQAEAQASALAEIVDDNLATKKDLKELEIRLENRLLIKLGTVIVACIGISTTLISLLISIHH